MVTVSDVNKTGNSRLEQMVALMLAMHSPLAVSIEALLAVSHLYIVL